MWVLDVGLGRWVASVGDGAEWEDGVEAGSSGIYYGRRYFLVVDALLIQA